MFETVFPASFAQQRLWFLDQLEPETAAYNLPRAFRILGPLDVGVLTQAIQALVRRHESLRTVFDSVDGRPRQIVLSELDVPLPVVDLSATDEELRDKTALGIATEEGKKPFDLTRGPLFRTKLVQLSSDQYLLILVLHHIITDGWSISVLFRDLTKYYEAFAKGETPDLPPLTVQYGEYAQWQAEHLTGNVLSGEVQYWKEKLARAQTILDLPTDRRRPSGHSWAGATEELVFDRGTLTKLKILAQSERATLFMVSMAAFQVWLWRYTQQESILVGTPTAGRSQLEIENVIGFFVNTLVFRSDITPQLTFREFVRQVREFSLEAYSHQDVPFEKLVEELVPQRSVNITPLFQAMFIFQNIPKQVFKIAGLDMEELAFESGIAKFDLTAEAFEDDDQQFHWRLEYSTDLFDRETICAFLDHFSNLLNAAFDNPDLSLAKIPLLQPVEQARFIEEINRTFADYQPPSSISAAFEQQVERTPDAPAVQFENQQLTYRQLNDRANRLAHYLIEQGAGPGSLIGISLERSPDMIVALLAVLKAGAAYVPVDPTYPADWISFVLDDSRVWGVVAQTATRSKLPADMVHVVTLDEHEDEKRIAAQPGTNLPPSNNPVAYVLYTSGSTGMPKGVEGTQRGLLNRAAWMQQAYPFQPSPSQTPSQPDEVCCQKTNLGFVDSVFEIFGPLLAGVPNVILSQETIRDPELLLQTLAEEKVTRIVLVPSLLRLMLDHAPNLSERVPRLRLWSCSGEVLPLDLVERFRQAYPQATLLNLYGSAEVAADATCHQINGQDLTATSISIGKPIANLQVYILDDEMQPAPIGVRGQIYVGGAGLARGYWRRDQLTAERFVSHPFVPSASSSERLYRTGDLGRWRSNGEIEYLGRADHQVKLRGMRIELGEIEAVLARHERVDEAVVVLEGEGDTQRLLAYVRLRENASDAESANGSTPPTAADLRQYLRSKLPEHMVPAGYRQVQNWPLLPSGKVDRRALAAQSGPALSEAKAYAPPRTEVELKLAAMWQELLRLDAVGIDQNFFDLGGHSLLALQVMARIRSQLDVELGVRSLFEGATIAALAAEVEKAQRQGQKARPAIIPRRTQTPAPQPDALLAQLDSLSPAELQALMQRALDNKRST